MTGRGGTGRDPEEGIGGRGARIEGGTYGSVDVEAVEGRNGLFLSKKKGNQ